MCSLFLCIPCTGQHGQAGTDLDLPGTSAGEIKPYGDCRVMRAKLLVEPTNIQEEKVFLPHPHQALGNTPIVAICRYPLPFPLHIPFVHNTSIMGSYQKFTSSVKNMLIHRMNQRFIVLLNILQIEHSVFGDSWMPLIELYYFRSNIYTNSIYSMFHSFNTD